MTIKIGYEQARDLLELAVAERGTDYIYQKPQVSSDDCDDLFSTCAYFTQGGQPSCMVGDMLSRLGVTKETLDEAEGENNNLVGVVALWYTGLIECDWPTLVLLWKAQQYQDEEEPWGISLKSALAAVPTWQLVTDLDTARMKLYAGHQLDDPDISVWVPEDEDAEVLMETPAEALV